MFVYVILLCSTLFVLVSANPLLQALAQQTCPVHNCQQDYRNLPVNRQQPRNINPYIQPTTVQNTPCPYIQSPQNEYEQMIFNKILANPTLRTLLDPNTKLLNQNGFEVQRQVPNNAGTVPNVINNYIIVPPELLLNEPMREEFRDDRRNHNRRRDETNPRRNAGEKKRKTNVNPKSEERQRPISQNARESRKKKQRQDEYRRDGYERDVSDDDFLEHDRQIYNPRRGPNDKRNGEAQSINRETQRDGNKENADKIDKEVNERRKTQDSNSSNKSKSTMASNEKATVNRHLSNEDIEERVQDRSSNNNLVPKAQIKPPTRIQNKSRPTNEENSVISRKEIKNNKQLDLRPQVISYPRNPREEAVIQNFRRKFPGIPENVVRNLLSHLKRQLENDQLGSNPYCPSCPINYDQLYKPYSSNIGRYDEGNINKNGRRKSGRRRNRKRQQQKKENDCGCDTIVELAPSIYVEEPVTTEPTTSKKEPIKTELEPNTTKREPLKSEFESTTTQREPIKSELESTTTKSEPIKTELELTTTKRVPTKTELEPTTSKRIIERSTIKSTTVPAATESSTVKTEKDFASTTTAKEIAETTTQSTIAEELKYYPKHQDDLYDKTAVPELGTEDVVPTIYMNGIVDDYYPDFTADNHAYAYSNENLYVQNLQEDRYHYTTDKNIKMKELNRDRRKYVIKINNLNQLKDRNIQSDNFNEKTDIKSLSAEIEATIPKPIDIDDISKEIHFRPPPFLEEPDFETKQINKGTVNTEEPYYYRKYEATEKFIDVTDKASTYSEAKTPKYVIREKSEKKKPTANIETVYAKSKVVKFGHTTERSDEIISNETKKDLSVEDINSKENKLSVDGDTTFVIAKSYPDPW